MTDRWCTIASLSSFFFHLHGYKLESPLLACDCERTVNFALNLRKIHTRFRDFPHDNTHDHKVCETGGTIS